METWDPKPDAVAQFRGPFGAIRTSVPGVQFGELLPETGAAHGPPRHAAQRQSRHRRPHQGQSLDADRLRGAGLQRCRISWCSGGRRWAPPWRSCAAPIDRDCRLTSPCRTCAAAPITSSTTPRTWAAAPIRSSSIPIPNTPEFRVKNLALPKDLPLTRLEDRRHILDAMDDLRRQGDAALPTWINIISGPSLC